MGLTPEHFLRVAREHTYALQNPDVPSKDPQNPPDWMAAKIRLGIMPTTDTGVAVAKDGSATVPTVGKQKKPLRELEIVE
jgi:hypothetical protein